MRGARRRAPHPSAPDGKTLRHSWDATESIHASDDPEVVRQLIRENPWCTLVSNNAGELVASHYPVLLDEESAELAVLTHVGRPDEQVHGFGEQEIMLIVQGRHGYISPSWYEPGTTPAPTWNFSVAHCYGVPEILGAEENLRVLTRLVEHFERHVARPQFLDPEWGAQMAKGTVGLRHPDHALCVQDQAQPGQEPGEPAPGDRCAAGAGSLPASGARRRHAALERQLTGVACRRCRDRHQRTRARFRPRP